MHTSILCAMQMAFLLKAKCFNILSRLIAIHLRSFFPASSLSYQSASQVVCKMTNTDQNTQR